MLHCSGKGSEVPLWVIIYHENFAERDWAAAKFLVYTQAIPAAAPLSQEHRGRQRQDRNPCYGERGLGHAASPQQGQIYGHGLPSPMQGHTEPTRHS